MNERESPEEFVVISRLSGKPLMFIDEDTKLSFTGRDLIIERYRLVEIAEGKVRVDIIKDPTIIGPGSELGYDPDP